MFFPVGMNEEQNLGESLVMLLFPAHLGLAFGADGYSTIELLQRDFSDVLTSDVCMK